ncbi:MAG: MlaD family protein [Polyangiales bacterium]
MRTWLWGWALLSVLGCDSTVAREAALSDARGLAAGAPVQMAGVTLAQVEDVAIGEGDAPVRVRFRVEEATTLGEGVRAYVGRGPSLQLERRAGEAGTYADIPPCAVDLEGLLDALPSLDDLPSLGEAAEAVGAGTREAVEGFVRGAAGDESVRDVGRAMGETLRELETGVREGTGDPATP